MKSFFQIFLLSLLLISCTQEPANVVYHLNDFYGYNSRGESVSVLDTGSEVIGPDEVLSSKYKVDKYEAPSKIEVEEIENLDNSLRAAREEKSEIGYKKSTKKEPSSKIINISEQSHRVSRGETLYAISRKYNIPILPIIIVNKLNPPYDLTIGQRIRIPEARFHVVEGKETLYSLSRAYGVDMNQLVKTNRLEYPYEIAVGQKLQIPFPTYRPELKVANDSKKIARSEKVTSPIVGATKEPSSKVDGEIPMHTSELEVIKPKGLTIMVPPTLKPTSKKALSYKTALLRKELDRKQKKHQKTYQDDGKFMWPTKGKLESKFGMQKNNEYNDGIYISAPSGAFVRASLSGKVVYTGDSLKSYGNLIIIKHNNGLLTAYAHLAKVNVRKDDFVKKGEKIGTVGTTGKVKSPQLYFAIRRGKEARDPMMYLR